MNLDKKDEKQLLKMLSSSISEKSYEFEVLFKRSDKQDIDKKTFDRIFKKLRADKLNLNQENPSLEIFLENENLRVSILGKSNIEKYRRTDDINIIDHDCLVFVKKKMVFDDSGNKIANLTIPDYNLKVKIKSENLIESNSSYIQKIKESWKSSRKILYRYKNRYSYTDSQKLFSFDLSIVKQSTKSEGEQINTFRKVSESNVFKNPQEYEIELEFTGNKNKTNFKLSVNDIYEQLLSNMVKIIQVIQNNSYILSNSEAENLLNNYSQVVCQKNIDPQIRSKINNKGHGGIGPKVVSLEMTHIFEQTEELLGKYFKDSHVPSILVDYSVTEKTDGERQFLFISNEGKGYLIDNLMNFRDINIHFLGLKNCILDGEYVTKSKHKENINHFLIFDCYFMNGTDVRDLPLYTPDKQIKLESRLDKVKEVAKEFRKIDKKNSKRVKIFSKEYKFGDINTPGKTIFKKCNDIWKSVHQEKYQYEIDGLIFTPIKSPVGGKFEKNDKFYSGRSWFELFKWKPPQDNTIDFLVKIQQEDGQDKIGYKNVDGEIKKYKTLLLYIGDHTTNKNIDPYDLIAESKASEEQKGSYVAKEFVPNEPLDPEAYIAHVITDIKNNRDEIVPLKGGGVIKNGMIVEMSYNKDLEKNWRWIPRNIRFDKTALRLRGDSQFGNNYKTAVSIWSSYYNPITENMILRGEDIPENPMDNNKIYYHVETNKRVDSPLIALRDFHNLYVKNKLYECTSNMFQKPSLLELACGKGGDMPRWIKHDFSVIVGIDLYEDNIENKNNGAIKRYLDNRKKYTDNTKMYFLAGDCGKNIKDGSFTSGFYENIFKVLWNNDKTVNINRTLESSSLGICNQGFDIISCQFAIHYFFKDTSSLNSFVLNLSENIKENGFFIGTCLDGKSIFDNLLAIEKDSKIEHLIDNLPLWSIKKLYEHSRMKNDDTSLGMEIDVFVASIGESQREYLVNFSYFVSVMEKYGFQLLDFEECTNFNIPFGNDKKSSGLFEKMYQNMFTEGNSDSSLMNKYGEASSLEVQSGIQKYSFFNRWFIFRKTGSSIKSKKIKVKK